MKNLNKFTKAELISKFKRLESKNSNQTNNTSIQSLFSRIVEFILYFKSLLFKIALISILIRTFKKYSLFSRILRFTNWIILSIFGISVIDNFGLDFIRNFFLEFKTILAGIVIYLSNTQFYSFLASLFKTREEVTNQTVSLRDRPLIEGASYETERSQIQDNRNSKISDWLKPEQEPIKEESSNTKYLIIAGIIIGCLAAYYWGDITPILKDLYDRIKPKKDGGDNQPSLDNNSSSVWERLRNLRNNNSQNINNKASDIYNNETFNSDVSQIELVDKTTKIASSSKVKLDNTPSSSNSMDQYFTKPIEPQLTGLNPITGQDFTGESTAVLQEVDAFLNYHNNASFPKAIIGSALYKVLWNRLSKLYNLDQTSYEQLYKNEETNSKIERFMELENLYINNQIEEEQSNIDTQSNSTNVQSDTYEEVAAANIESRMAWSDRATPSVHSQVLSPVSNHENLDNSKLDNLIDNTNNLDDTDLLNAVKETYAEEVKTNIDIVNTNQQVSSQDLPNIGIDSASSSDNSMNQYFSKPDNLVEDIKPKFTFSDLLDSIKSKRDDSNVVGSPQISQLGLSPKLSPLNTKPSISNLLDDTTALFEDDDDIGASISNIDKGKEAEQNLLSAVSNPWDNVKTIINYGDSPNNINVELNYGNLWTRISKYRFIMNNDQIIEFDFSSGGNIRERTFDLSKLIKNNSSEQIDIKEIKLLDLNYEEHSVWTNNKFFN